MYLPLTHVLPVGGGWQDACRGANEGERGAQQVLRWSAPLCSMAYVKGPVRHDSVV